MRLFIGGMRGSRPCTGSRFEEFGGDTTSLLLRGAGGERLVLDTGTGMHSVAGRLSTTEPGEVTILFSHYHLDHMAGLMMNPLFHSSDWSFKLIGPTFADGSVRDAVTHLLARPYWPISCEQMNAQIGFVEFDNDGIQAGNFCVHGCEMPHPGGCLAYRIDDAGSSKSLVYATDIEWQNRTDSQEKAFIKMCCEPGLIDLLIIDAHFSRADAESFAGWGHTCWEDDLEFAESLGVKNVLLGHHDPEADDNVLRAVEQQVKKRMPGAALARAGQWISI